jgi:hypothetical protein
MCCSFGHAAFSLLALTRPDCAPTALKQQLPRIVICSFLKAINVLALSIVVRTVGIE